MSKIEVKVPIAVTISVDLLETIYDQFGEESEDIPWDLRVAICGEDFAEMLLPLAWVAIHKHMESHLGLSHEGFSDEVRKYVYAVRESNSGGYNRNHQDDFQNGSLLYQVFQLLRYRDGGARSRRCSVG